jgi:hypothetical protein
MRKEKGSDKEREKRGREQGFVPSSVFLSGVSQQVVEGKGKGNQERQENDHKGHNFDDHLVVERKGN